MANAGGSARCSIRLRKRFGKALDEWVIAMANVLATAMTSAVAIAIALQQGGHHCRRTGRCQFKAGAGNACTARLTLTAYRCRQRRTGRGVHGSEQCGKG